jgi:hypothetical protein
VKHCEGRRRLYRYLLRFVCLGAADGQLILALNPLAKGLLLQHTVRYAKDGSNPSRLAAGLDSIILCDGIASRSNPRSSRPKVDLIDGSARLACRGLQNQDFISDLHRLPMYANGSQVTQNTVKQAMREGTTTKKRCPRQRAATSAQTRQKRGPIYMKNSAQCTSKTRPREGEVP